ncbi:ABC transporter ATP-binding protein [Commensalibacter oyaizuii]|uniref:ATP-binding cassette domain-containing protein n=1 Tax=Commensalibacter oyaizuii TaxID=3043873 RepID=A0ABT6PY75_9PROT|nr:ATP-binding cassette domain-containing protein [Commensalibacter sp. TBRC 16381]MDI2089806.1 ATP-binding cassette domain-containing protein [Commensalibacter sp. TBRC 16381]
MGNIEGKSSTLSIQGLCNFQQGPYFFEVRKGDCVVITGESGVGKSILLRMIADLIPNNGEVYLNTIARSSISPTMWRKKVTYIASESGWWAKHVKDHVRDLTLVQSLLNKLNLKDTLLDAEIQHLSTGERQRMALLRALSSEVEFLLLDEVTSALDPDSVLLVEQLIQELQKQGKGILLVSHNMEQVRRLATRHYHLTKETLKIVL